jgi:YidC/Oxa1 family membrane protein insertase
MQHRNYILFVILSMGILVGWQTFVLPLLLPKKPVAKNVAQQPEKPNPQKAAASAPGKPDTAKPDATPAVVKANEADAKKDAKNKETAKSDEKRSGEKQPAAAAAKTKEPPVFEHKTISIGSLDPTTGYFLRVDLDSKGAAVSSIELNDPRYRDLKNDKLPLKLVGNDFDLRFLKLLEDRDNAQSEQRTIVQVVKEAEAGVESARDTVTHLAKEVEPGGARAKDPTAETELERRRTELQAAQAELDRHRTELQTADEKLHRAERNAYLAETTFNTDVPDIDSDLPAGQKNIAGRDWSVDKITRDPDNAGVNSAVTFHYPSPDGQFVVEKRYSLASVKGAGAGDGASTAARRLRDSDTAGYLVHLDLTLKNLGKRERKASYVLQGPVGLPLENADNARKFRDLKWGFLLPDGGISASYKSAATLIADRQKNKDQEFKAPVRYFGVDVQYFAALVLPVEDQLKDRTIEQAVPMILDRPADQNHTDVSVQFDSAPIVLAPQQAVTQRFELFAGPKRKVLVDPLQADGILDTSYFSPTIVRDFMTGLLDFFHGLGFSYGIAIICLTICVRACMFPLSLRQTAQAQRMKELQPRIEELKKKFGSDKEKFAMAQMQLWREHKINPMSGCLPLFVQLPVFTGLWMALNSSVDLRRAPFLYIRNLAAPDALFHLPFVVPYLGWTDFNLLPFFTVALFVVQQKMFMPPPTDEQQEMQYKMMNVMTIVMGVMFYKVPAGLCVYFISSSLWGIGERKLLEYWKKKHPASAVQPELPTTDVEKPRKEANAANKAAARAGEAAGSIWKRLLSAADQAGSQGMSGSSKSPTSRKRDYPPGKKNGKRSR